MSNLQNQENDVINRCCSKKVHDDAQINQLLQSSQLIVSPRSCSNIRVLTLSGKAASWPCA